MSLAFVWDMFLGMLCLCGYFLEMVSGMVVECLWWMMFKVSF